MSNIRRVAARVDKELIAIEQRVVSRTPRHLTTVFILVSVTFVSIAASRTEEVMLWDWLLITGVILLALGIYLADRLPERLELTLRRLAYRDAIKADEKCLSNLFTDLETRAQIWARWCAPVIGIIILVAFAVAGGIGRLPLALFEATWGYMAGRRLGRMISYGLLGRFLKRKGIRPKAIPGHLDGAAGLKPIGDFFFRQSMIVAIPAIYLAAWLSVIPDWPRTSYQDWQKIYVALLAVSISFEVLAFVIPMWIFHRRMQEEKRKQLRRADELTVEIAEREESLRHAQSEQERKDLQEQIAHRTTTYWDIEKMPTWPVAYKTKKVFTTGNVAMVLVPVLSNVFKPWGPVFEAIGRFLAGE